MVSCAVATCKVTRENKKSQGKIILHRFPKSNEIVGQWIARCKRDDKINPSNARICSNHFTEQDYERDLKGKY